MASQGDGKVQGFKRINFFRGFLTTEHDWNDAERYHLDKAPFKWFEGPIYKFINKQNELSMRRASDWLTKHPEYRADLVDA